MNSWSKDLRRVLGIVLVGFSVATIATVLDRRPSTVKQALPDLDLNQVSLSDQAIIFGYTIGLEIEQIQSEQAPGLMERLALAEDRSHLFFEHPQSAEFSVKRQISFNREVRNSPSSL